MPWTNTNSSMIGAYDYDEAMRVLHIRFRNTGQTYSYQGVPPDVAKQLADAPSIGKFFKANIERQFHSI